MTIPVLTSHYLIDPELLKKMSVTEQMIRLSVGVEHVEDLIADLEKGLAVLSAGGRGGLTNGDRVGTENPGSLRARILFAPTLPARK